MVGLGLRVEQEMMKSLNRHYSISWVSSSVWREGREVCFVYDENIVF